MPPINRSIRQIDENSWLIEESLLLCRKQGLSSEVPSSDLTSWSDGNGGSFFLARAHAPLPETRPLSDENDIQKVYDAGGVSAVWRAGEAFVKLKQTITPNATREHTTLQFLRSKQPLDFNIPDLYYHTDIGNRYLVVLGRVAGYTLSDIWYEMGETRRQECVCRIAKICIELATWESETIGGIDGKQLTDQYLLKPAAEVNFDSNRLLKNCSDMGMDCSSLLFYHCDLGPGNILFDESDGSIGIIDWETAGYVPKEWIRTKFRCSSGMDLPDRAGHDIPRTDWRRRVSRELERLGLPDVAENWVAWHAT